MSGLDNVAGGGQVRQLRRAAAWMLRAYGIKDCTLRPLAHHRQTTFRVECKPAGQGYVLRLHPSSYRAPDHVQSEFRWLRYLATFRDVVIPEPVPTTSGEDVPRVDGEGLPTELHASLLKWVAGRRYFRRHGPGVRVLREVGKIMATMHNHAEAFKPPKQLACPVWNWERLFRHDTARLHQIEKRFLTRTDRRLFARVEGQVAGAIDCLGTGRNVFGVIHGDLMQANYLIHRRQVHVIDFADFGIGHFLYDMAITLFALWGLDPRDLQRQAFLSGYRQVRELSPDHERLLNVFIAGRGVVQARFVMTSEFPEDQAIAPKYVRRVIEGVKLWLK